MTVVMPEIETTTLDLDNYHGWFSPDQLEWLGWIPGTSMWKLISHSHDARILFLKRQDGQELQIGMDAAELKSLHKLLESDILRRYN